MAIQFAFADPFGASHPSGYAQVSRVDIRRAGPMAVIEYDVFHDSTCVGKQAIIHSAYTVTKDFAKYFMAVKAGALASDINAQADQCLLDNDPTVAGGTIVV